MTTDIHLARVCLAQVRHFRTLRRGFSFTLPEMAANARKRAALPVQQPAQMELF